LVAASQEAATREEIGAIFVGAYGGDFGLHYGGGTRVQMGSVMPMAWWQWQQEDD
jgi:hypothetical protein